jgi:hypothetical protein
VLTATAALGRHEEFRSMYAPRSSMGLSHATLKKRCFNWPYMPEFRLPTPHLKSQRRK